MTRPDPELDRVDHSDHAHADQVEIALVTSASRAAFAVLVQVPGGLPLLLDDEEARETARRLIDAASDLRRVRAGLPAVAGVHVRNGLS